MKLNRPKKIMIRLSAIMAFMSTPALFADENVTIPMTSYKDLLSRIESVEKKVTTTQHSQASTGVSKSSKSAFAAYTSNKSGFFANTEYVYARPIYSVNTAFYVHDVSSASEGAQLQEFDYGFHSSGRLELGYLNSSKNIGWKARYWQFGGDGSERSAADVDAKIGVADDPDIAIDTVSPGDPDFLKAVAETDLKVFDVEAFRNYGSEKDSYTVGAGIRFAKIDHLYDGQGFDPTTNIIDGRLIAESAFRGFGPTVSFVANKALGDNGFSLEAGGRGSLLFGNGSASWRRFNNGDLSMVGDEIIHDNDLKILPVMEFRLGVNYIKDLGQDRPTWRVGAGIEGQYWINGGTPINGGQDGATDSDRISSPWGEDFGLIGGYLRVGVDF